VERVLPSKLRTADWALIACASAWAAFWGYQQLRHIYPFPGVDLGVYLRGGYAATGTPAQRSLEQGESLAAGAVTLEHGYSIFSSTVGGSGRYFPARGPAVIGVNEVVLRGR
jgi:hypothetical protein